MMAQRHEGDSQDLFQSLLELEYGLLDESEAVALRARIDRESEVARVYAAVRGARSDLALAARIREPTIVLEPNRLSHASEAPAAAKGSGRSMRRWVNRFCGVAAGILAIAIIGEFSWYSREQRRIPREVVVFEMASAASLHADASNNFDIEVKDLADRPVESEVEMVLREPAGEEMFRGRSRTNAEGRARITVPKDTSIAKVEQLEIYTGSDPSRPQLEAEVASRPVGRIAHLATDRSEYRPGETMYFRAVVLHKHDLTAAPDGIVKFALSDIHGETMPGLTAEATIEKGVAFGAFVLPSNVSGTHFALEVQSTDESFRANTREILVHEHRKPRLRTVVELGRASYSPGDSVTADYSAERLEGGPAARANLRIRALLSGSAIFESNAKTDEDGTYRISFVLPATIQRNKVLLTVAIDDGGFQETTAIEVPVSIEGIHLALYPESGVFVPDVENRVYFAATSPDDRPAHIHGEILDTDGRSLAAFESSHEGLGRLSIVPKRNEAYRVESSVAGQNVWTSSIPVASDDRVALVVDPSVFDSDAPIRFEVRSAIEGLPVVVAATCRGVLVGSRLLETAVGGRAAEIDLPPEAAGVIRITLFDRSVQPMKPIAERLVYRRPSQRLDVSIAQSSELAMPGQRTDLTLLVRKETGQPAAGAILGVSVVDRASAHWPTAKEVSQETAFLLTSEIDDPESLENADFYLADDPESANALDLVLGTHGWRTFQQLPIASATLQPTTASPHSTIESFRTHSPTTVGPGETSPLVRDNRQAASEAAKQRRAELATRHKQWLIVAGVGGAIVLLVFLSNQTTRPLVTLATLLAATLSVFALISVGTGSIGKGNSVGPLEQAVQESPVATEPTADPAEVFFAKPAPVDEKGGGPQGSDTENAADELAPGLEWSQIPSDGLENRTAGGAAPAEQAVARDGRPGRPNEKPMAKAFRRSLEEENPQPTSPVRIYAHDRDVRRAAARSDFTQTLFWHPMVVTDEDGLATVTFDLSDAVSTFDVRVDGHSESGRLGSAVGELRTRLPFRIEPTVPEQLGMGDQLELPVSIYNTTSWPLKFELACGSNGGLRFVGEPLFSTTIAPNRHATTYLRAEASEIPGPTLASFVGVANSYSDRVERPLNIAPLGFPRTVHESGQLRAVKEIDIELPTEWHKGSMRANLKVYSNPMAEILDGAQSVQQMPVGGVLQAASSSYLNAMALQYLHRHAWARPEITRRCRERLIESIEALTRHESPVGGFDWFGHERADLTLSAFVAMVLHEAGALPGIDPSLLSRTQNWILKQRSGNGGYRNDSAVATEFGQDKLAVTAAFVTWTLAETGATGIEDQIAFVRSRAEESEDPILLALAAMVLEPTDRAAAIEILRRIASRQESDGSLAATAPLLPFGIDSSMRVETTALAVLAWVQAGQTKEPASRALEWLRSARKADGGFGMPQTTALALKAIVAYSEARADEFEPGTVSVALVDSQDAGAADQNLGRLEVETHTILPPLQLSGFEDIVAAGRNRFRLRSATSGAIGYRFWVDFQAEEIKSNDECPIVLDLKLDSAECRVGERIGLAASVTNRSETIQPMVTAVIGIPAGLELPPETLDRLKSQKLADSIQSRPRELTLCWRDIGPKQRIDMSIDLIAAIPGRFTGPPSRAFLTHSPDIGTWIAPRAITITRDPFVDGN